MAYDWKKTLKKFAIPVGSAALISIGEYLATGSISWQGALSAMAAGIGVAVKNVVSHWKDI